MEQDLPGDVTDPTAPHATSGPAAGATADERAAAEDADLASSLVSLSHLSAGWTNIEELLVRVAGFAVQAIPGADGAGLTLSEPGRPDILVKTTEFVRVIDEIQYRIAEGPCVSAAATGVAMRPGSLGGDQRWPRFGPRAGRLGVHSVLSLPLRTPSGVVGAMNIYAHAKDAFDARAEELGQVFAVPAAIAVHNAQILAQTDRLSRNLQAALATRPVIDQAIGILRSRTGSSAEEAFERLRSISQNEHVKLVVVASRIVDRAVLRARDHRTQQMIAEGPDTDTDTPPSID